jgi:hypothetical protein
VADIEERKLALDHAWGWVRLQAGQRLQLVYFWLVATAFLTTALASALSDDKPQVACFVATAGAVATICFHRLERRTRALVKTGEAALAQLQRELATGVGVQEMALLEQADVDCGEHFSTYGDVIRVLHYLATTAFAAAAAYAGWRWSQ